jgi:general transcription factor 3C polypeptide 5 (transcription factor C subunit 1)
MASSEKAPSISIGHQVFQSVEHPGTIGSSSTSLAKALKTLGPPEDLDGVFNRTLPHLDLRLRPDDHWAHPISGERSTTHRLLLKVSRRRRRHEADAGVVTNDVTSGSSANRQGGVYKVDIPGSIKQTVRFRGG